MNMNKVVLPVILLTLLAGMRLSAQNYNLDNNYTPTPLTGEYLIDGVTKMSTTDATFDTKAGFTFVAADPISTNRYFYLGSSQIPFQIYKTNTDEVLFSRSDTPLTTLNVWSISLSQARSNLPYSFYIQPTSGLIRKPGLYSPNSPVKITLNSGTLNGTSITNTQQKDYGTITNLKLNVSTIGDLSIQPAGVTTFVKGTTSQDVKFSPTVSDGIYEGQEKGVTLVVRTNGTWTLSMATGNGIQSGKWVMKANSDANEVVPYSVYVDGVPQTLNASSITLRANQPWPSSTNESLNGYASLLITFKIGSFFSIPDTYKDNVTFNLSVY
ncbi:MAG: hypothetical protein WAZ31_04725 [Rectinemataceae bacterium]